MTRAATWTNSDGLLVGFGANTSSSPYPATVRTQGNIETIVMTVTASDMPHLTNPNFRNQTSGKIITRSAPLPAGAVIHRAKLNTLTTWNSISSNPTMTIGLVNGAGTVIDANAIFQALTELSGKLNAGVQVDGSIATYGGTLVNGTASIGAVDAFIYFTISTGVWDAGLSLLTVEYARTMPDDVPTNPITGIVGTL